MNNEQNTRHQHSVWNVGGRTFAITFAFVCVPWCLVALPGDGEEGQTVYSTFVWPDQLEFGWPFVHMASARKAESDSTLRNVRLADKPARIRFEPRLGRAPIYASTTFWSDRQRWPQFQSDSIVYRVFPLALILNILFVCVAAYSLAALRQYCRGVRYSLRALLLTTAMLALVIGWIANRVSTERIIDEVYDETITTTEPVGYVDRRLIPRFPLLISQLFNHGEIPDDSNIGRRIGHSTSAFFKPTDHLRIDFSFERGWLRENDLGAKAELIQDLVARCENATETKLALDLYHYDRTVDRIIRLLLDHKITRLGMYCDSMEFASDENMRLNFAWTKKLRHLETLELSLGKTNQSEQLGFFLSLPTLKDVSLWNVSVEGARYLQRTESEWPRGMTIYFLNDVPQELQREVREKLDVQNPICGSALPIAG